MHFFSGQKAQKERIPGPSFMGVVFAGTFFEIFCFPFCFVPPFDSRWWI
jgi:hypothetical protein